MPRKPDVPEPNPGDAPLLNSLRESTLEAAVQQLRIIHELGKGRGAGAGSGGVKGRRPRKTRPSDLLFDLARISASQSEQWLRFGSKHLDLFLDLVRPPGGPRRDSPDGYVRLSMTAPVGKPASAKFIVENPHSTEAVLSVRDLKLQSDDGAQTFSVSIGLLRLDPPFDRGSKLDPGECAHFRLLLKLERPPFEAGRRYLGETVALVGGTIVGQLVVEVSVI
jgi:hypothetical protein